MMVKYGKIWIKFLSLTANPAVEALSFRAIAQCTPIFIRPFPRFEFAAKDPPIQLTTE